MFYKPARKRKPVIHSRKTLQWLKAAELQQAENFLYELADANAPESALEIQRTYIARIRREYDAI